MPSIFDDERTIAFFADTHPELRLSARRVSTRGAPLPTFVGVLDTRAPLAPGPWRSLRDAAHLLSPRTVAPRALFVGLPFEPYEQTHLVERAPFSPQWTSALVDAAAREGCAVVVWPNVRRGHAAHRSLVQAGFIDLPSFPDCVLDTDDVTSFEDVIARRSRTRRKAMRRHARRFARAGHVLSRETDAHDLSRALFACYAPLFERANVRWFPHHEAYLGGIASLGPDVMLSIARDGEGGVSGFVLGFVDESGGTRTFHAARIGVHPRFHHRDDVYFRLVYRAVEDAIEARCARVSLEPTAYRVKLSLGARLVPLVNMLLPVSSTWRLLARGAHTVGARALAHLTDADALAQRY